MALPAIAAGAALRAGAKKLAERAGKKLAEKEAPIVVGGAGVSGGSYIGAAESAKKREEEQNKKYQESREASEERRRETRTATVPPSEEARRKSKENVEKLGFKKGGSVSSASKRADGCAVKGKTKGRMV